MEHGGDSRSALVDSGNKLARRIGAVQRWMVWGGCELAIPDSLILDEEEYIFKTTCYECKPEFLHGLIKRATQSNGLVLLFLNTGRYSKIPIADSIFV